MTALRRRAALTPPRGGGPAERDYQGERVLDAVADEPNDRQRKRLGFAKPIEEISERLLR